MESSSQTLTGSVEETHIPLQDVVVALVIVFLFLPVAVLLHNLIFSHFMKSGGYRGRKTD